MPLVNFSISHDKSRYVTESRRRPMVHIRYLSKALNELTYFTYGRVLEKEREREREREGQKRCPLVNRGVRYT